MSDKKRYPAAVAMAVAGAIKVLLAPFCDRIEIAGSLRRQKKMVGDIEILFIGKQDTRRVDLLTVESYDTAGARINELMHIGILTKRPNKNGVFAWGEKNKLGIHVETGIPIDFFATCEPCWYNALVCRTGGIENNLLITTTAQHRGWSFEAYGSGFKNLRGERHDTTSEEDVYKFIGLRYLEPKYRK
jgi:DNA polymerase/3'-5' exonuclease PolX